MFYEVFSNAFSFIKRHWQNLLIAVVLTEGSAQFLSFAHTKLLTLLTGIPREPVDIILGLAPVLPWFALDSIVVWLVIADQHGQRETLHRAARAIVPRLPVVFAAGLLGILLTALGFILIIPGIIAFVYFFLVVPVATIEEGKQVRAILKRSKELVIVRFGAVFSIACLFLLPGLLLMAITFVLNLKQVPIGLSLKLIQTLASALLGGMLMSVVRAIIYARLSSVASSTTTPKET